MGCSYGKSAAIGELNEIIKQISQENSILEKERDKLRSQHDDRPEEEKDSLKDLRLMHNDLEKEIKELKDIMMDFMPQSDSETKILSMRSGIQQIHSVQGELEEKSTKIKEMITKREDLKKEHENLETLIIDTEKQIAELEAAIENQEDTLKDQENIEEKLQGYEKEKSVLIEELKEAENVYRELSDEVKNWEGEDVGNQNDRHSYEALLSLSEAEVNRELKNVEKELEDLSSQIKDLESKESELQQMEVYISSLQNKLNSNTRNNSLKQQILESQERIEMLKKEKKQVKEDVSRIRKVGGNYESTNEKLQTLDNLLADRRTIRKSGDSLFEEVEETLKKVQKMNNSGS